jgi:hypothetical protein
LTTQQWIEILEQMSEIHNWNEPNLVFHMQSRLRGSAKSWYEGLSNFKRPWLEWKRMLLENFPEIRDQADQIEKMRSRSKRRDETYEQYYFEKMKLVRPCNLPAKTAVDYIIRGLDEELRLNARLKGCETPEELLHSVILKLSNSKEKYDRDDSCRNCGQEGHYWRSCQKKLKYEFLNRNLTRDERNRDRQNNRRNENRSGSSQQSRFRGGNSSSGFSRNFWNRGDPIKCGKNKLDHRTSDYLLSEGEEEKLRCFNCNEIGHKVTECRKKKIKCYNCQKYGHMAKECDQPKQSRESKSWNEKKPKVHRTILHENKNESEKEVKKGHTECYIRNILLIGFIDSGSEVTLMGITKAKELGLEIEPKHKEVIGYGDIPSCVTIGVVRENIRLGSCNLLVEINIVPDHVQSEDILMGQDVVENVNVVGITHRGKWWFLGPEQLKDSILVSSKVPLKVIKQEIIPPMSVKFCKLSSEKQGTVYVEEKKQENGIYIPSCVIAADGFLPVANLTKHSITYKGGQVLVRAVQARLNVEESEGEVMTCRKISKERTPFTLKDLEVAVDSKTDLQTRQKLLELINEYRDCFAENISEIGTCKVRELSIELEDSLPVVYRPYRLSYAEREFVKKQVREMKENGIIRESSSPYASPILLVRKKNNEWRFCVDFRRLNLKTLKDRYPLPRIDDLLDRITGCCVFSCLDLASGYWQIKVALDSISKTAFVTPDGHYEWLRMPFGVTNGPALFQRTMNTILSSSSCENAIVYLDDVLLASTDVDKNLADLRKILKLFREVNLTLRLSKCRFLQTELTYLGHELNGEGLRPSDDKIRAVQDFPKPVDVHTLRQFLGLASYFRKFIKNFSSIAAPLTSLLQKGYSFRWGEEQDSAFSTLKKLLIERPILAVYNPEAQIELHTDACAIGIGSTLIQPQSDGKMKPIAYFSQKTTAEEKKYHSYELETLAIVRSLQRFRIYLYGKKFKLITDCSALRYTLTKKDLVPRIARWWLLIQDFDFEVVYRPNTRMKHVDSLSRNPVSSIPELYTETVAEKGEVIKIKCMQTRDWVRAAQMNDPKCREIAEVLGKESPETPREREIFRDYMIQNDRVFRKTEYGNKWVVPLAARKQVLALKHDYTAHPGCRQTELLVRRKFWFPNLRQYVKNYTRSCLVCIRAKRNRGVSSGPLHMIQKKNEPFDTLHIDHLGPFVKTVRNNQHMFVVVDAFTKYVWGFPTRSTTTKGVIDSLNRLFDTYGVPRRIICDRGTAFTSFMFQEFCHELGIRLIFTAIRTPRAIGQVERPL